MTEQIIDAFPDFMDKFHIFVPLVHELFVVVREAIENKRQYSIESIAQILGLGED